MTRPILAYAVDLVTLIAGFAGLIALVILAGAFMGAL